MRTGIAVSTALLLASCASTQWSKPGGTAASLTADQARCHYEAEVATASISNAVEAGMKEGFMEAACLKAKGWSR